MNTYTIHAIDGSTRDVVTALKDVVLAERHFNRPASDLFEKEVRVDHLSFLSWAAERRLKTTDLEYDDWLDDVETIVLVLQDPPTGARPRTSKKAPSTSESPDSP